MTDLPIRFATPEDAPLAASLVADFRSFSEANRGDEAVLANRLEALLAEDAIQILLSGDPPHSFALLTYSFSALDGFDVCRVDLLLVGEKHRRSGVGRALLRAAERAAEKRMCRRLELNYNENNAPARGLYLSEGFTALDPAWGWGRDLYIKKSL